MSLQKNTLIKYWQTNEKRFNRLVNELDFRPCGVWYTDAFLFLSICDLLEVDMIIESGRAWGVSTELFAKYSNFEVHSVEQTPTRADHIARPILEKYDNVVLYDDNTHAVGRDIIQNNYDKNIGVFIDGPKGIDGQSSLAHHLNYSNVKVFGFHDRTDTDDCDFHTFTLDFLSDYMYLNDKIFEQDPEQLSNGELGCGCLIKIN
jgi:hypothetical protein